MGFFDVLFGEGPSVDVNTLDTLTPEQQAALNRLISQLSGSVAQGGNNAFGGNLRVEQSDLAQTSLDALENRALQLVDPKFQSELSRQSNETLLELLNLDNGADIDSFFNSNVKDPLVQQFTEEILPQIGRSFGGSNFFSGERAKADSDARGDLVETLGRSRESLAFNARESDRNRALQALGLVGEQETRGTNELLSILDAGNSATALEERNVNREFEAFLAEAGLDNQQIAQLLQALGIPQLENVVTANQGTQGLIGPLLQAAGAAGGFGNLFSDERLKENVRKFSDLNGIPLYRWNWNSKAQDMGIDDPTIGVLAQDVEHLPGVVSERDGFKTVDYVKLMEAA